MWVVQTVHQNFKWDTDIHTYNQSKTLISIDISFGSNMVKRWMQGSHCSSIRTSTSFQWTLNFDKA